MNSKYIIGIHDRNPLAYNGWEIRTEGIGHNPSHMGGTDYRSAMHPVIARLNDGYPPTIPESQHYEAFAQRVQNFVRASRGCSRWVIGNETNHAAESGSNPPIYPSDYARCYQMCRSAIHALSGHEQDIVIVGAVAPYNNQTAYSGNPDGNWVIYFSDVLDACGDVDGIALHTYSSEQRANIIASDAKMGAPFQDLSSEFYAYRDFMEVIPERLYHVPIYITETNPGGRGKPWQDANTGWCQAALDEIMRWNEGHYGREIHCLAFYAWEHRGDGMQFQTKRGVQDDFLAAAARNLTWRPEQPIDPPVEPPIEPPIQPPTECLFNEDVLRRVLREELALLYENLRDAMQEEIRQQLNKTVLKVQ